MQVVVFFQSSHKDLENKINYWLSNNPSIEINHISQSSNEHGHCVTLWYRFR
ncbi:MAG: hypothetical protein ACM3ZQ_10120 [Bacillota bacterium]